MMVLQSGQGPCFPANLSLTLNRLWQPGQMTGIGIVVLEACVEVVAFDQTGNEITALAFSHTSQALPSDWECRCLGYSTSARSSSVMILKFFEANVSIAISLLSTRIATTGRPWGRMSNG